MSEKGEKQDAPLRIKPIRAEWFKGFSFESPEWAVGIAKLAMNIGARSGRKGFAPQTVKYHARAAITKVEAVLEILCEYHFLVAKDARNRFWVCSEAFALKAGQESPSWSMDRDWDERRLENAPGTLKKARAAGWAVADAGRGVIDSSGESGDEVPEPEASPTDGRTAQAKAEKSGGKHGEYAPTVEAAAGGAPLPRTDLPIQVEAGLMHDDGFLNDILGVVGVAIGAPAASGHVPTMDEVTNGVIVARDGEDEDAPTPGDRVVPDTGGAEFVTEGPRLRSDAKASKGKVEKKREEEKSKKESEKKKEKAPTFFVVMDPMAPAAFSGETDKRSALDKLADKFGDFANEPWKIISDALATTNRNENAAVKMIADRIHVLSRELTSYVPPEKTAEWADYLSSLQDKRYEGSGKKSDYRLANATIRFIMRFMARHKVPVAEIAMSLQEILQARGERDEARYHSEIAALRGEIDALKKMLEERAA